MFRINSRTVLVLTCALLAAVGCSDDDPNLGLDPVCVEFRPDRDPTAGDVVAQDGEGSTCDTAEVELVVTGVSDVYGASFTAVYDPATFLFLEPLVTEDSFLSEGGTVELEVVTGGSPGELIIGLTRVGVPDGVTPTTGNDVLAALRFFRLSTLDSELDFTLTSLESAGDPEPEPIPGVEWFGGRLDVN